MASSPQHSPVEKEPTLNTEPGEPRGLVPPEKVRITGFIDLFKPPDNLTPETKTIMISAGEEVKHTILEHLDALYRAYQNAYEQYQTVSARNNPDSTLLKESADNSFYLGNRYAGAVYLMQFLGTLCEGEIPYKAHRGDSVTDKIEPDITDERGGGYRITLRPYQTPGHSDNEAFIPLGFIPIDGGRTIKQVGSINIVVRSGEKPDETHGVPMQINFVFRDENGNEIESIRIDMHNTREQERLVHMDTMLGTDRVAMRHQKISAISESDSPEENFRTLQMIFFRNLCDSMFFQDAEDSSIQFRDGVATRSSNGEPDRNNLILKKFIKAYQRFGNLPEDNDSKDLPVVEIPGSRESQDKVNDATGTYMALRQRLSSDLGISLITDLHKNIIKSEESPDNGLSAEEVIINKLLEKPQKPFSDSELFSYRDKLAYLKKCLDFIESEPATWERISSFKPYRSASMLKDEQLSVIYAETTDRLNEPEISEGEQDSLTMKLVKVERLAQIIKGAENIGESPGYVPESLLTNGALSELFQIAEGGYERVLTTNNNSHNGPKHRFVFWYTDDRSHKTNGPVPDTVLGTLSAAKDISTKQLKDFESNLSGEYENILLELTTAKEIYTAQCKGKITDEELDSRLNEITRIFYAKVMYTLLQ